MSKLWSSLGPVTQGMILGYVIVFLTPPILWLLVRWWALFFPMVMS